MAIRTINAEYTLIVSSSAQLTGAVEYANVIFVVGKTPFNQFPGDDTKLSDDEALVLEIWVMSCT